MLLFESLSAGGVAVLVALITVLLLVGIYSYCVWPFTHWDLANIDSGAFYSWSKFLLIVIFAAGSAAGFWCFSGAAFREKTGRRRSASRS
jgi:hypothetical protein